MEFKMIGTKKVPLTNEDLIEIKERDIKYQKRIIDKQAEQIKQQKRIDILAIASETDQLNMLMEVVGNLSEWTKNEKIKSCKKKFKEIKNILNK